MYTNRRNISSLWSFCGLFCQIVANVPGWIWVWNVCCTIHLNAVTFIPSRFFFKEKKIFWQFKIYCSYVILSVTLLITNICILITTRDYIMQSFGLLVTKGETFKRMKHNSKKVILIFYNLKCFNVFKFNIGCIIQKNCLFIDLSLVIC